jgi:hypothetical protein
MALSNVVDQLYGTLGGQSRAQRVQKAKQTEAKAVEVELLAANLKSGHKDAVSAWESKQRASWVR